MVGECLMNENGCRMSGFANMQADGGEILARRDSFEQLLELLKGIRL